MARFSGWHLTRTGILFVIGIIVLGGLVTGGVFLIKNQGEMVRRDQAAKIAEQNLESQSKTTTSKVAANSTSSSSPTGAGTSATTTPPAAATPVTTQLPVTGIDPFTTIETAGILAILAFSVTSFVVSRRASQRL